MQKFYKFTNIIFIIIAAFALTACPQTLVKHLDNFNQVTRPPLKYLNSSVKLSDLAKKKENFFLDSNSLKIPDSVLKQLSKKSIDSLKHIEYSNLYEKLNFEIRGINSEKYPNEINIQSYIFNNKGKFITGLASPYKPDSIDYHHYWKFLTDSCNGEKHIINNFKVTEIRENEAPPQSIAYVLDVSGSMITIVNVLRETILKMVQSTKKGDYYSVIKFAGKPFVAVPLTDSLIIFKNLFYAKSGIVPGSAIYDGLDEGINELNKSPTNYIKNIILFSDGMEGGSKIELEKVLQNANSKNIRVFSICYGVGTNNEELMKGIADKTNGRFYQVYSTKEFPFVFADIYLTLKNYYKISYMAPECIGKHYVSVNMEVPSLNNNLYTDFSNYTIKEVQNQLFVDKVTLINIEFDFGKSNIKSESFSILDNIADKMRQNLTLKLKICGNTDNIGSEENNLRLSKERAESVAKALIERGIMSNRLITEGEGSRKPVVANDTEEHRMRNRRTEFIIIEN